MYLGPPWAQALVSPDVRILDQGAVAVAVAVSGCARDVGENLVGLVSMLVPAEPALLPPTLGLRTA